MQGRPGPEGGILSAGPHIGWSPIRFRPRGSPQGRVQSRKDGSDANTLCAEDQRGIMMDDPRISFKRIVAAEAVKRVEPGMVVGLGHGSTAMEAVRALARRLERGEVSGILGIPCSRQVEAEANRLGIPLTGLEDRLEIDLTIDGADEVAPNLDVIKGGGGALLREKIVAQASLRQIIIVDESKLSPALGSRFPIPVEVLTFGWRVQARFLEGLGARVSPRLRAGGGLFETDQGNLILDCAFGPIEDPRLLAREMEARAGILEHGLFLGLVDEVIVAGEAGVRMLTAPFSGPGEREEG